MQNNEINTTPPGWDKVAHHHWGNKQRAEAIQCVLNSINAHQEKKPLPLALQFSYYLFLIGDTRSAAKFLESIRYQYPNEPDLLLNLGVCLSRSGQYLEAINRMNELLSIDRNNVVAYDILAKSYHQLKDYASARAAGTKSLTIKDKMVADISPPHILPASKPSEFLKSHDKKNVIAFSLWGKNPRYLRGAIDNATQAPIIYPGWTLRYYLDVSVPQEVTEALESMQTEIVVEPQDQSLRQRLGWRFKVANDQSVARFLVRDVDSVINQREAWAVNEWIASDEWFHVMRDWWTHTDLILAGMWGGVSGTLPDLHRMLKDFRSPTLETPNIDQMFLRHSVWPLIRKHCLVLDRYFTPEGAIAWGDLEPEANRHVGQDIFSAHRNEQERRLNAWINKLPSLRIA